MDLLPQEKQPLTANLWQAVTSFLAQELTQAAQGVYALLLTCFLFSIASCLT
jgi:hypothetical protein